MSDDKVTQNHWGSGHNINAGTVNIGRQPFVLTQQAIVDTVLRLGDAKTVSVSTYGPMDEARRFVSVLSAAAGRPVTHESHVGMSNVTPPAGIAVNRQNETAYVSYNPT